MENKRALIISVICATISIVLITSYVKVRRYEMTSEFGEEVPVVVATEDIPEYGIIRPASLKVVMVFKNYRQPQTLTDVDDAVGRAAFVPIYKGEQITLTKLVQEDGKPVLDREVEKTKRAITLQVAPHTGVGHLIRPGNRIDILCAVNYDNNGSTIYEIKTMVQNVLVLATGKNIQNAVPTRVNREVLGKLEEQFEQRKRKDWNGGTTEQLHTSKPDDNYTHITVQLSPEDAEKVMFLAHTYGDGRLYYVLRNSADQGEERLDTTLLDDVLGPDSDYGRSKKKPPPLPPPKGPRFNDSKGGVAIPIF